MSQIFYPGAKDTEEIASPPTKKMGSLQSCIRLTIESLRVKVGRQQRETIDDGISGQNIDSGSAPVFSEKQCIMGPDENPVEDDVRGLPIEAPVVVLIDPPPSYIHRTGPPEKETMPVHSLYLEIGPARWAIYCQSCKRGDLRDEDLSRQWAACLECARAEGLVTPHGIPYFEDRCANKINLEDRPNFMALIRSGTVGIICESAKILAPKGHTIKPILYRWKLELLEANVSLSKHRGKNH